MESVSTSLLILPATLQTALWVSPIPGLSYLPRNEGLVRDALVSLLASGHSVPIFQVFLGRPGPQQCLINLCNLCILWPFCLLQYEKKKKKSANSLVQRFSCKCRSISVQIVVVKNVRDAVGIEFGIIWNNVEEHEYTKSGAAEDWPVLNRTGTRAFN